MRCVLCKMEREERCRGKRDRVENKHNPPFERPERVVSSEYGSDFDCSTRGRQFCGKDIPRLGMKRECLGRGYCSTCGQFNRGLN